MSKKIFEFVHRHGKGSDTIIKKTSGTAYYGGSQYGLCMGVKQSENAWDSRTLTFTVKEAKDLIAALKKWMDDYNI